jgi:hypothetical protein
VAHSSPLFVNYRDNLYGLLSGHPLQLRGVWQPSDGSRGPMADEVDLRYQAVAEEDQQALVGLFELYILGYECSADVEGVVVPIDVACGVYLAHDRAFSVIPWRGSGVVGAQAGAPAGGRDLHPKRLVGTHMVVLVAERVQLRLLQPSLSARSAASLFQRLVEAFHLALGLRMSYS